MNEQLRCKHCGAVTSRAEPRCTFCGKPHLIATLEQMRIRKSTERTEQELSRAGAEFDRALAISRSWQWFVEAYAPSIIMAAFGVLSLVCSLLLRGKAPHLVFGPPAVFAVGVVFLLYRIAAPTHAQRIRALRVLKEATTRCRTCGANFLARPSEMGEVHCSHCGTATSVVSQEAFASEAQEAAVMAQEARKTREDEQWRAEFRGIKAQGTDRLAGWLFLAGAVLLCWAFGIASSHWSVGVYPRLPKEPELLDRALQCAGQCVPTPQSLIGAPGRTRLAAIRGGDESLLGFYRRPSSLCMREGEPEGTPEDGRFLFSEIKRRAGWVSEIPVPPEEVVKYLQEIYGERAVLVARPQEHLALNHIPQAVLHIQGLRSLWEVQVFPCGEQGAFVLGTTDPGPGLVSRVALAASLLVGVFTLLAGRRSGWL